MNYENIKLEKGMYRVAGKSFTQVLEELDPSANYRELLEKLDAFQRQLKRFDIKVSGANSDIVEKFFATSDSAALFPEYMSRAIRQGIEEGDALSKLIATKTMINGMDYRTIETTSTDLYPDLVEEGAVIPKTTISTQENLTRLCKRGRMLEASYEAIRFQHLDLITVTLKQIGSQISAVLLADAINTLIKGDGNENPITTIYTGEAGTLKYSDMLELWAKLAPYQLNCIIAAPAMIQKMLALSEFQNPLAGMNFQGTGNIITPIGAEIVQYVNFYPNKIIGLDKRYALEMVQSGEILVESDKLIDRQIEQTAVTVIAGFSKIFTDASMILSISN